MKRLALTLALAVFSLAGTWAADINAISNAFKSGNAQALAACMDTQVDLAFQGATSKAYAGAEAVGLLKEFFGKNKPAAFRVIHHADKKDNGFFVAKLSAAGKEYRVNITYRSENNQAIIQSIRIE